MKTITGMSLVEMMLGLTLSMMIFNVVIELYLAATKLINVQNALLSIEENQQMLTHIFRTSVHTAGFIGCAKLTSQFPIIQYPPYAITAANRIESFHSSKMITGTQGITIRSMNTQTVGLIAMQQNSMLEVSANQHFQQGDILVIADCKKAELFKIKNIIMMNHSIQIEPEARLQNSYASDAEIAHLQVDSYFIGKTTRKSVHGEPIYALYQSDVTGRVFELVEGVNDMQIQYINDSHDHLVSISLQLQLRAVGDYSLEKQVVMYVALRQL